MNELMNVADGATMTSLEIAELVDKQHSHVLRDIRIMLAELYGDDYVDAKIPANKRNRHKEWIGNNANAILDSIMGGASPNQDLIDSKGFCPRRDAQGRICEFRLNKKLTLTLTSGYKVKQRAAIIDRWLALEDAARIPTATQPLLPAEIGKVTVMAMLDVAKNCGVPDSYAMQVAAAEATRQTGMPWDKLLTKAAVMSDIPDEDVMLEPTELGALLGLSGAEMNMRLATMGLQEKIGGKWTAIGDGCAISSRHAWTMHGKSGYNLKWKAGEIEELMEAALIG